MRPYDLRSIRSIRSIIATLILALALLGVQACDTQTESSSAMLSALALLAGSQQQTQQKIVMFATTTTTNGALGGRSGADAMCSTKKSASHSSLSCKSVRAYISVDATDEIRDFPANYALTSTAAIYTTSGSQFATNWADLLDGSLAQSASSMGITSATNYYTGSQSDGSLATGEHCSNWSSSNGGDRGQMGWHTDTATVWMSNLPGNGYPCSTLVVLLCVCVN